MHIDSKPVFFNGCLLLPALPSLSFSVWATLSGLTQYIDISFRKCISSTGRKCLPNFYPSSKQKNGSRSPWRKNKKYWRTWEIQPTCWECFGFDQDVTWSALKFIDQMVLQRWPNSPLGSSSPEYLSSLQRNQKLADESPNNLQPLMVVDQNIVKTNFYKVL